MFFLATVILHATDAVKGIDAHVVHGYVVHDNDSNTSVQLTYPRDGHQKVITGRSFHHGRFVMKLRGAASKAGYVLCMNNHYTLYIVELYTCRH